MRLTRLVLKRPTLVFVFVALTLLGGFTAARGLIVQALPNVGAPTISVELGYPGASTTFIRDNIVAPLENEIAGGPGLDHMDSTIQVGSATIKCTFRLGSDPNGDLSWVLRSVAAAGSTLPLDLLPPYIRIANPGHASVMSLALTSKTISPGRLAQLANVQIMPAIENPDGVSDASVRGLQQASYNVTVDPSLLASANLTLNDIVSTHSSSIESLSHDLAEVIQVGARKEVKCWSPRRSRRTVDVYAIFYVKAQVSAKGRMLLLLFAKHIFRNQRYLACEVMQGLHLRWMKSLAVIELTIKR